MVFPCANELNKKYNIEAMLNEITYHIRESVFVKYMVKELARFLGCSPDLNEVIEARNERGKDYRKYINELFKFSYMRRFDLKNIEVIKEGEFAFDFIEAAKFGYEIDHADFKINPTKYRFDYNEDDKFRIQCLIDQWGIETLQQIGKLCQKSNLLLLSRRVSEI